MTFIPTPDAALCVVHFSFGIFHWTNNLWFTKTLFTLVDQQDLADCVDLYWGSGSLGIISSQVNYDRVVCYDERSAIAPIVISLASAGPGTQSGHIIGPQDACVLSLYTNARGRTGRGRLYYGGVGEDHFDGGSYDGTTTTALETLMGLMEAGALLIGWTHVVVSKQEAGVPRSAGVANPVVRYDVRSAIPGTQRRRTQRP